MAELYGVVAGETLLGYFEFTAGSPEIIGHADHGVNQLIVGAPEGGFDFDLSLIHI